MGTSNILDPLKHCIYGTGQILIDRAVVSLSQKPFHRNPRQADRILVLMVVRDKIRYAHSVL